MKYHRARSSFFLFFFVSMAIFISGISSADPLDSWHVRNSPVSSTLRSATYGNAMFVTVGDNGTILNSTDGVVWTSRVSGTTVQLNGVTYGNGMFVAVGSGETILTSLDGGRWTIIRTGKTAGLNGVTYGNGIFVAVGSSETILTSTDAANWTIRHSGTYSLDGVTYGEGRFIALGEIGALYVSNDGINWNIQGIEGYGDNIFFGITFGKSVFTIVGGWQYIGGAGVPASVEIILSSFDGLNWTQSYSGTYYELHGAAYGNGNFVAVGYNGTILSSPGGTHWTARHSGTTQFLYGAAYGNGTFVVVGYNGTILQSDPMVANTDCTAILSSDLSLHVPIINNSDGSYLWADFQYEAGATSDIMLKVTNADFVSNPSDYSSCQASTLSYDKTYKLQVPSISFDNLLYRADLEYVPTGNGRIWFKLTTAEPN